jgi:protein-S-isoprenylcysteine O-methyltransferase Ste14
VVSEVLIIKGSVIIDRSVILAHGNDLGHPEYLLTGGPYAFSRNPMYLSWVMLALGIVILVNSLWLGIASLAATLYINFVTIPREERDLQRRFESEYTTYRQRVRRWL